MKRSTKHKAKYTQGAAQIIERFGGTYTGNEGYPYTVPTKAGDLLLSIGDDCCVCTRFVNIDAALDLGLGDRLNVHSGKWNWMGGNDHQGDMLDLAHFQQELRKIV